MSTILTQDILRTALVDLREGRVQDADDRLEAHLTYLENQDRAAAELAPSPPPQRAPAAVVLDILRIMSSTVGNPEKLESLISELAGAF